MLTSIAVILLLGLLIGWIFSKLKLPSLLGMVIVGIVLSPHALNLIDESILGISGELRQIALVIILTRAGLSLDVSDLKKVGRPAVLMCFVPACVEILGTVILAPMLLGVTMLEASIIGSVIAAVSPAVIVPRMIKLIDEGYGKAKSIPQLILAGASVDDVFVIVVFTAFTALASTGEMSVTSFIQIPISVEVYSDSKYVVDAFNQHWVDSWLKKGWKRGKNEPVKNIDLWKRLLSAKEKHQVRFCWVKGHDGHPQNERCDTLATTAADGTALIVDEGVDM